MDIKEFLTDKDIAEIKQKAIQKLISDIASQFDVKQIAAEVRNSAIKKAVSEVSDRIFTERHGCEAIDRAMQSVEHRVNAKIQKVLESGIKVSFGDK